MHAAVCLTIQLAVAARILPWERKNFCHFMQIKLHDALSLARKTFASFHWFPDVLLAVCSLGSTFCAATKPAVKTFLGGERINANKAHTTLRESKKVNKSFVLCRRWKVFPWNCHSEQLFHFRFFCSPESGAARLLCLLSVWLAMQIKCWHYSPFLSFEEADLHFHVQDDSAKCHKCLLRRRFSDLLRRKFARTQKSAIFDLLEHIKKEAKLKYEIWVASERTVDVLTTEEEMCSSFIISGGCFEKHQRLRSEKKLCVELMTIIFTFFSFLSHNCHCTREAHHKERQNSILRLL